MKTPSTASFCRVVLPQLGGDEEVPTLGITSLKSCIEAIADGWLVEVVAGTVDVPTNTHKLSLLPHKQVFNTGLGLPCKTLMRRLASGLGIEVLHT